MACWRRCRRGALPLAVACALLVNPALTGEETVVEAGALVRAAFDYYRDRASVARVRLTIHRPDWERSQVLHAWTVGEDRTLITIADPPRDRGNGTLKLGGDMWTYNPRVNRIIKLPPSLMSQAWMGSDFSNNDLAKADSIIRDYTHRLLGTEQVDGQTVYIIESTPLPGAPVIWGKEILRVRADHVFLEEAFYDEDGLLVKRLSFEQIELISGKLYPRVMTMRTADEPGNYTRVEYLNLKFLESLPAQTFTREALRNPPAPDLP